MNYLKNATKKLNSSIRTIPIPKAALRTVSRYVKKQTQKSVIEQFFESLIKTQKQIISSNKMSDLAEMSYSAQNFEQIINLIFEAIDKFCYTNQKAYRTRNTMIVIGYLLRHGASGFIDQFRSEKYIFENYTELHYNYPYAEYDKQHKKIAELVQDIKNRAKYIIELLEDKNKMLKEKQLSMLIKQKMKIYKAQNKKTVNIGIQENDIRNSNIKGDYSNRSQISQQTDLYRISDIKKSKREKVQDFLQNYLFKYYNRLDQKIEQISQKIVIKIDQYLIGEIPQQFQIDQLQQEKGSQTPHGKSLTNITIQEKNYVDNKISKKQYQNQKEKMIDFQLI